MEKRIPIDELFHKKLHQGREQVNLGAWANMERMLDGKNPYTEQEEKKRSGFLPFLLLLLVTTGIAGAGYFLKSTKKEQVNSSTLTSRMDSRELVSSSAKNNSQPNSLVSDNVTTMPSENTTQTDNIIQPESKKADSKPSHSSSQKINTQQVKGKTNLNNNNALLSETENGSANKKYDQTGSKTNSGLLASSSKKNIAPKKFSSMDDSNVRTSKASHSKAVTIAETNNTQENAGSSFDDKQTNPQTKKVVETFPMVTVNQKITRNRDGSEKGIIADTIERSTYERITEEPLEENTTASIDPMISNPRFRKLSEKEEQDINQKKIDLNEQTAIASTSSAEMSAAKANTEISLQANQQAITKKQTGYFDDLRKFFHETYEKISNFMLYKPKPNVYTGLNMGVNASLSNSKHNFGGFHGGFVMLRPINDYFSFITECKFYYRNNGGYTVNDISYKISDRSVDNISMLHNTIYSFQKDSSVKTYNFKNFYSLELPLLLQTNYRAFALYGGLNLVYNFKLKTTEKSKNYVLDYKDTVLSTEPYSFPIEKASQFVRSDFSSRFGLGYTIGASYNFSPQLYVDLRVAQNVWDNMKTNSAREISTGFFKVPSIQLSLGYRFRKFVPDN